MEANIIRNSIRTPDGTELVSEHQYDYKTYIDANGKTYMVDGGSIYQRRSANGDEVDTSVYDTDDFEIIREVFKWGTRGKSGNEQLIYKPLKELDTDHIEAILKTQHHLPEHRRDIFKKELEYRNNK